MQILHLSRPEEDGAFYCSASLIAGLLAILQLAILSESCFAQYSVTDLASASLVNGGVGDSASSGAACLSADGRVVVYFTNATDMVPGEMSSSGQLVAKDLATGLAEVVSVSDQGVPGNGVSFGPRCSADGRYVVFVSTATNLASNDTDATADVFLRDRSLGTTTCLSTGAAPPHNAVGGNSPDISRDGRFVVFSSHSSQIDLNYPFMPFRNIFLHDREQDTTRLVSSTHLDGVSNNTSSSPRVSGDGSTISFLSRASNLVPGDTNMRSDVFVRELGTWQIERISVDSNGNQASLPFVDTLYNHAELSVDGQLVSFEYRAPDMIVGEHHPGQNVYLRDRQAGTLELINLNSQDELAMHPVYAGADDGNEGGISDDGRYVLFWSTGANLSPPSAEGWRVPYVRDRVAGITRPVALSSNGVPANAGSDPWAMSADGRFVVFSSQADNLTPNDDNLATDVFVRDMLTGGPELVVSNAVAGQAAQLSVSGCTPSTVVFVAASLTGQGVLPSYWGPLELSGPLVLLPFASDGTGTVNASVPLPPSFAGLPLWVQGLDLGMNYPTSIWAGTVQ